MKFDQFYWCSFAVRSFPAVLVYIASFSFMKVIATDCNMTAVLIVMCLSVKVKVKVKVKVNFTLEQATKAQRWSRGKAILFL
jgi:hypothetical protein